MRRLHARLAAACVLAVATAVFTGSALAGDGGAHGNSANAPGQQEQPAPAPQQQSQQAPQQQSQPSSHGVNSTSQGTKPSPTTGHNTSTHVGDSPDVSKRYGNGKTAGQIAKSRGAGNDVEIKGPGNSQPHKVCRNGHWVDVHAVKSYSDGTCTATTKHEDHPVKHEDHPVTTTTPTHTTEQQPVEHKVTLCHATGSSTNPFVTITVDYHALKAGHTADKGDIIPPTTIDGVTYSANWDAAGQAIFNNGCKPVAAQQAPVTTTTTTTTPTTTSRPEVAPTTNTVTVTVTTTTTTAGNVAAATTTTTPQLVPATTATTSATGGVLGAQTSLAKPKAHHGVLGTVTHVAGGTLPFTGFPVWLAVLIALALILAGIALRRRTMGSARL
jgi:hypothetical protein